MRNRRIPGTKPGLKAQPQNLKYPAWLLNIASATIPLLLFMLTMNLVMVGYDQLWLTWVEVAGAVVIGTLIALVVEGCARAMHGRFRGLVFAGLLLLTLWFASMLLSSLFFPVARYKWRDYVGVSLILVASLALYETTRAVMYRWCRQG